MIRSLWIAKTGLDAQQTNLDVISNNLANGTTTAMVFGSVHRQATAALFEAALARDMRLIAGKSLPFHTGNPQVLAIDGNSQRVER